MTRQILEAITRRSFVDAGLRLVDNADCPLCDSSWEDVEALKGAPARQARQGRRSQGTPATPAGQRRRMIADQAKRIAALIDPLQPLGERYGLEELGEELARWSSDLRAFAGGLGAVASIAERRDRLEDEMDRVAKRRRRPPRMPFNK